MRDTETIWIPLPDGTRLAARLWQPDRDAPVPAILEYIPYRRRDGTRLRDESMHPHFADAGYASLRVDIRGYGDSEGTAGDEYSEQETQDGVDVIAWIAAQPWCDGNVGMFGKSWGAYNSLQVAARRPPALRAIAPVMGTDDRWLEDIHFYGGCLATDSFWWGAIMQYLNALPPDPAIVGDRWRDLWLRRLDAMTLWPADWLEHQRRDGWWRRGSVSEDRGAIEVPIHYYGGWADLYRDTPFRLVERHAAPARVTMGPWAHLYPHDGTPGPALDFVGEMIAFWDRHLKRDGSPEGPHRFYLQRPARPTGTRTRQDGTWVALDAWTAPGGLALPLGDGTLGAGAMTAPRAVRSPQDFGRAGGDMCSFAIPGDLPADGREEEGGAATFRSAPLDDALDLLGRPSLSLRLSSDGSQAMVAALLYAEAPDGGQTLISRGFANLAQRNWTEDAVHAPEPLVPGDPVDVTVDLHATGTRLAPGHRLVLHVGSAYWPVLWPVPGRATLTLHRGMLSLPERTDLTEIAPPAAPPPRPAPNVTRMREGALDRSVSTDRATGTVTHRTFIDGGIMGPAGVTRLDDIGTVQGLVSERIYRIHPDDPLSAEAVMTHDGFLERDDWRVRVVAEVRQTATATAFRVTGRTTSYAGDEVVHDVAWDRTIPRDGM
ncbi:CocE/NonD family hydrolase [Jannaschia sp. Os4]|uniref:CocE/NonD family hydrolase n=1 Tax=Jannaschia sp. Os4 TaxID=2807617 RepID=UPI0019395FC7|nr:CocE/NonD family hydrolase [Jannaschia sp. Os4]MBM2575706.1 CocE/NonD family hydrolase [Jannaschia sp. Os4]